MVTKIDAIVLQLNNQNKKSEKELINKPESC